MSEWDTETSEWYAKEYGEYATNRFGVEALELAADSRIVDIGCGTGSALRHAAKQVTNGTLIGIDPVPRMVEIAQEQTVSHPAAERIKFIEGSAESLPIDDASADFVFAFDSFDHWQDQSQGLKEARRVLDSDGRLVVVKDGELPNGTEARQAFVEVLVSEGFRVIREQTIEGEDVSFTMWICASAS